MSVAVRAPREADRDAALLAWARACVREAVGGPPAIRPHGVDTAERVATFVTLRWRDGALQGCIGALTPYRTLLDDVASNAYAAATRDPRGRAFRPEEVDDLDVEISILSAVEPLGVWVPGDDEELKRAIRVGVDGLILEYGTLRGTLLPSMWEQLPDVDTFLKALARKAGLPPVRRGGEIRLSRYTTRRLEDPAPSGLR